MITKSLGEKKSDNLQEPLVENIVVEHPDQVKKLFHYQRINARSYTYSFEVLPFTKHECENFRSSM